MDGVDVLADRAAALGPPRQESAPAPSRAPVRPSPLGAAFNRVVPYLLVVAILAVWQAATTWGAIKPLILPSVSSVVTTLYDLAVTGELFRHVRASLIRVLNGFALAVVLGLAFGVGMGLIRPFARLTDLLMQVVKPIPPIAWIPLAIIWFGIDEGSKVFLIFVGAFFPIMINTLDAVRQTDKRLVEVGLVLEVPRWRFVRDIVLPGALPQIMSGLRIGAMLAWMCVVAAELTSGTSGIGFLIMDGRSLSQSDVVIAGMLTLGLLGKVTDDILRIVERRMIRWRSDFAGIGQR